MPRLNFKAILVAVVVLAGFVWLIMAAVNSSRSNQAGPSGNTAVTREDSKQQTDKKPPASRPTDSRPRDQTGMPAPANSGQSPNLTEAGPGDNLVIFIAASLTGTIAAYGYQLAVRR